MDLKDKDLRMKLLKLILMFEEIEANKSRKSKVKELLEESSFIEFGKIV